MKRKKMPRGGWPRFDYGEVLENLEDRNEAAGQAYAEALKKPAAIPPPTPPTPPTAPASPGPDEEPEEPAEPTLPSQGMLFDLEQPTCPHCSALVDDASLQTGKCYVCDESFDPTNLVAEEDKPHDDQTEMSF